MEPNVARSGRSLSLLEQVIRESKRLRVLIPITAFVGLVWLGVVAGWIPPEKLRESFALTIEKLIENLHWLIPAVIGVMLLRQEVQLRRELHEKELDLNEKRFAAEQADREARRQLFNEESSNIRDISRPLSKDISENLAKDSRWASEAMERAKLGAHGQTVFGERVGHFLDEKNFLAEMFTTMILARCAKLSERVDRVYLVIDSGTTLYPFFGSIGEEIVRRRENRETWIDKLEIVTNNLPGVEALIASGRRNPRNRFSPLEVKCQLLPGEPLPVYAAVTGESTVSALHWLRGHAKSSYFLALMTGNWLRIGPRGLRCPLALARGKGHLDFKQALIECANETFVVTPLGKIWVKADLAHINDSLGLATNHRDLDKQAYEEVTIRPEIAERVKLVSTSRGQDRVLSSLYHHLEIALQLDPSEEGYDFATTDKLNHVLLPGFDDKLPHDWGKELATEFPHRREQRHVREHDFFVPQQPPTSRQRA
jgi:hypothetical protein